MHDFLSSFAIATELILSLDKNMFEIIILSLEVSFTALSISCIIGLFLGSILAVNNFYGKNVIIVLINALMGLPPVVVGLIVYLYFSRSGPFGWLGILYTPTAMIIAQTIIIIPIIASLSRQILQDLDFEYAEHFESFCLPKYRRMMALVWDARFSLTTVVLSGFGRAISEVRAVIIVGGNIDHFTRVMTTAIALETSKGDLALALALGLVLLTISILVNICASIISCLAENYS